MEPECSTMRGGFNPGFSKLAEQSKSYRTSITIPQVVPGLYEQVIAVGDPQDDEDHPPDLMTVSVILVDTLAEDPLNLVYLASLSVGGMAK